MASGSATSNKVFISYSSPAEDEFLEMLVKDLNGSQIEVATREMLPLAPRENHKQWSQRKCKSVAAVLVVMSSDLQEDDECKADAEAATELKSSVFFAKAKPFNENEWMKKVKADYVAFDLTPIKYKANVKLLIASLKQVFATQGVCRFFWRFLSLLRHIDPLSSNILFWKIKKLSL